jgi:hypothetical protein
VLFVEDNAGACSRKITITMDSPAGWRPGGLLSVGDRGLFMGNSDGRVFCGRTVCPATIPVVNSRSRVEVFKLNASRIRNSYCYVIGCYVM